ncbi:MULTISPECIES: SDR family oxidoreductase [unclassified Curtobacterium]|jgi:nucleoside-diphosphate-sugar epimerase|uniref:SDR family oxidoreductase n=1 Tax=unclassified Curtobacterium TaxID=257496 RepID=UPI00089E08D2|nr:MULTISPECIES: SDR family oxidoreductase [unclassified Curtobacterium]AOX65779.1 NAD-dependent dehydratase [Curtobacterium sp. BH-2-1-1]MCC8906433.1 SDR family oxidoreductase [Curtobacterium sp. GD1]MCT9620218.1 SDR family oxidoreductase [Curtobacterium sp. C2H10]SFF54868.1 Putative NADH-flavin reductase [Curtobacterium sp. YR515]
MSNVIVLGGHGKVALLATRILTDRGHTVTSVIRDPDQADEIRAHGGQPHVADIQQQTLTDFAELIHGHDAVVWSAGAGGGSADRTWAIDRDAAILSVQGAAKAGVDRYVMVSWSGSLLDHGVPQDDDFFAYAQSKMIADAVLRDSGLRWTVVAPSTLTDDEPTGSVDWDGSSTQVPRGDVAHVVADAVEGDETIGRTIRFNTGSTPIADFLRTAG